MRKVSGDRCVRHSESDWSAQNGRIDPTLCHRIHPIRELVGELRQVRRVVVLQNPLHLHTALEASFPELCLQVEVVSDVTARN